MKKIRSFFVFAVIICAFISGCSGADDPSSSEPDMNQTAVSDSQDPQKTENTGESSGSTDLSENTEENTQEKEEQNMEDGKMYIKIGKHTLTATMADNSSAQALLEKLKDGDITVNAHDFSNFEKVGELGFSLPTNNEQITTQAGDLILYQGSNFVLYYDTNSWNFTRLGKVEGVTQEELKQILGKGDVTMVLSLNK